MGKVAIVIGSTGLVGNELLHLLLNDNDFSLVKIFVRQSIPLQNNKLKQIIVDYTNLESVKSETFGDIVFCCVGTTMKKAGSKDAFLKVDYTIPIDFAHIAKKNNIPVFAIVSSLGADASSSNFYLNVKGKVEQELINTGFDNLIIVRPSMLLGDRKEFRLGELIGKIVMKALSFIFIGKFRKYKAIEAKTVARGILKSAIYCKDRVKIIESDELQQVGG